MKVMTTSIALLTAVGFMAGVSTVASACEWAKTAKSTPVPAQEELAAPASKVDPTMLAQVSDGAIVPRSPEEELTVE